MKVGDLEKNKGSKIKSKLRQSGTPERFGAAAGVNAERREQRRRDQEAGLVPFAVKLDVNLVNELRALAHSRAGGLNEVVAELLHKALAKEVK
jgi:hypothetical protein